MAENENEYRDVLEELSVLSPGVNDAPKPAVQALAQVNGQVEPRADRPSRWRLPMLNKRRYVWTVLSLLVLIVIAASIPGVRAAASDFLGLFRVQKFAPISISPEQIALLSKIAEEGLFPGEIEMLNEPGPAIQVKSLDKANAVSGWIARAPGARDPAGQVYVIDGGAGRLTINVENTRRLVAAAGADPTLIPDSLEGAVVDVTIYPAISQSWNDGLMLNQSPSPLVDYPDDVDTAALGEVLLQSLGVERRQARRLARSIDWSSTLLLPIPEGMATFNEVSVDGVDGIVIGSMDGKDSALLWQKDGMVYVLSGGQVDDLVRVADSLR